jgi:hypothetical protein
VAGRACGVHWLAAADHDTLKLVSCIVFLPPILYITYRFFDRHKERLLGAEVVAARAARERAMAAERTEEASGFQWSVPAQVELRRLPVTLAVFACFYVGTLLLIATILGAAKLVAYLLHSPTNESAIAIAVKCANVVWGTMFCLLILLIVGARVRVTLGPDAVIERLGSLRHAYPYRSITRCRIEPSTRVPSLRCLAFTCEGGGPVAGAAVWHRFEFGPRVSADAITEVLTAKGVNVEFAATAWDRWIDLIPDGASSAGGPRPRNRAESGI